MYLLMKKKDCIPIKLKRLFLIFNMGEKRNLRVIIDLKRKTILLHANTESKACTCQMTSASNLHMCNENNYVTESMNV